MDAMLAILLVVVAVLVVLLWLFLQWRVVPRMDKQLEAVKDTQQRFEDRLVSQGQLAAEVKGLLHTGQQVQQQVSQSLQQTLGALHQVRASLDERRVLDDANRQSLNRLEEVLAGAASKGGAGENILHEVFQQLPQDMVLRRVRIGGGEVEYALRLTNQKLLPIDSKWGSTALLEQVERAASDQERNRLRDEVDAVVTRHVLQVEKYIDHSMTVPWAVAVVPDAAYRVIRKAHIEAQRRHVFIVSYGLAVPYLLSFFHLYLQHSRSIDMDQLASNLSDIQRTIEQMTLLLENQIERAGKMIQNAAGDYRQLLGRLRGSVSAMSTPQRPDTLEEAVYDRSETA